MPQTVNSSLRFVYKTHALLIGMLERPACVSSGKYPYSRLSLTLAKAITEPNRPLWHCVAGELLRKIGYVVQIELRANKQMLREEELYSHSHVDLEMIRIPYGLGYVGAHGGPYARIL